MHWTTMRALGLPPSLAPEMSSKDYIDTVSAQHQASVLSCLVLHAAGLHFWFLAPVSTWLIVPILVPPPEFPRTLKSKNLPNPFFLPFRLYFPSS
jgi:hypothetical protein